MLSSIEWNANTIMMACIFGLPIISVVAYAWRSVEKSRGEIQLKRDMVQRGMSAEEIERVLSIKSNKDKHDD